MKIFYALFIIVSAASGAFGQTGRGVPGRNDAPRIVRFYPNPATSLINFDLGDAPENNYKLQIFNFLGKKVFELSNPSRKTVVNLNDFYRGVYIFQLRDRNGKIVESGKFQVSK